MNSEYIGAGPPAGTGLHRYVFLLYKQKEREIFDLPHIKANYSANRDHFNNR